MVNDLRAFLEKVRRGTGDLVEGEILPAQAASLDERTAAPADSFSGERAK